MLTEISPCLYNKNKIRIWNGVTLMNQGTKNMKLIQAIDEYREQCKAFDYERDRNKAVPEGLKIIKDVSYSDYGDFSLLDIYMPEDAVGELPVIVHTHGGAFCYGSKEVYQFYCMSLAKQGFAVVNYNYRLSYEYSFPAPIEDLNQLLTWLAIHAQEYGLNTEQMFLAGDSAGANISYVYMTLYSNPEYGKLFALTVPKVKLLGGLLNCGPYDFVAAEHNEQQQIDLVDAYYQKPYSNYGALIDAFSFVNDNFPPCYVMTANKDFFKEEALKLDEKLSALGVEHVCKIWGSGEQPLYHIFHIDIANDVAVQCNKEQCEYLKSLL